MAASHDRPIGDRVTLGGAEAEVYEAITTLGDGTAHRSDRRRHAGGEAQWLRP